MQQRKAGRQKNHLRFRTSRWLCVRLWRLLCLGRHAAGGAISGVASNARGQVIQGGAGCSGFQAKKTKTILNLSVINSVQLPLSQEGVFRVSPVYYFLIIMTLRKKEQGNTSARRGTRLHSAALDCCPPPRSPYSTALPLHTEKHGVAASNSATAPHRLLEPYLQHLLDLLNNLC